MDTKFKYEFDSKTNILHKIYFGPINMEEIESSWKYAFNNNLIPKDVKGFILDYRKANFEIQIEKHTEISNFYKNHIEVFGGLKIAIITESPRDIVIPVMVNTKDEGYSSRPFTTVEAAIAWISRES